MKIAVASDHAGFKAKQSILTWLQEQEIPFADLGCHNEESCDYPDFAQSVASGVSEGRFDNGILICGTGIGMAIAANKVPGVRAAVCWSKATARLCAEHNDANVLCLPSRFVSAARMPSLVKAWMDADFAAGRHQRRVDKITQIERKQRPAKK